MGGQSIGNGIWWPSNYGGGGGGPFILAENGDFILSEAGDNLTPEN
jgi:hypothetical protein|tara:strand:+ start:515 stop:652 length:138 start_codon:yes stop_codon:yes gene_type:complete